MPEAEDVVLHAAERATHAVRRLWQRRGVGVTPDSVSLATEARRLAFWIDATVGASFALVASDPPPHAHGLAGWLAGRLGDPPPWAHDITAQAFTDGERLFLPRQLAGSDPDAARTRLLFMALGQVRRATRGSLAALSDDPLTRDIFWALDGAITDGWLAAHWPGLEPALRAERAHALLSRPAACVLRPVEWRIEALVRALLAGAPEDGATVATRVAPGAVDPESLAGVARLLSAGFPVQRGRHSVYRGFAPVAHWGVPRGDLLAAPHAVGPQDGDDPSGSRGRSRTLPRRMEIRDADPEELEGRSGAFALAFGEPELGVQDPAGVQRPRDQGDEPDLEALADELADQTAAARVRAPGSVRDVLVQDEQRRAPASGERSARAGDVSGSVLRFPEWDIRRGAYIADRCRVTVRDAERLDGAWAERVTRERAQLLRRIRRRFEALRPRRARYPRQLDGDDLDLAAFVDEQSAARAGASPPGRIYSLARPRRRDVAVALLLDVSGSTDAQVHGPERVIDVEKAATLAFCEALAALGDRHAVYAFSGHGPEGVRVRRVKRFGERLGDTVRARIGGLEPESFTRLGAALRFATARLAREGARVQLLLVLSDGKPYDDDEYAGEYAFADVRQAVAEAELAGVRPFCLTIDHAGAAYLPRLFGVGRYALVANIRQLPERLPELYRRLTAVA